MLFTDRRFRETAGQMSDFVGESYESAQELLHFTQALVKEIKYSSDDKEREKAQICYDEAKRLISGYQTDNFPISRKLNDPNYKLDQIALEHLDGIFPTFEAYEQAPDRLYRLANSGAVHHLNNQMQIICGFSRLIRKNTSDANVRLLASRITGICDRIEEGRKGFNTRLESTLEEDSTRIIQ